MIQSQSVNISDQKQERRKGHFWEFRFFFGNQTIASSYRIDLQLVINDKFDFIKSFSASFS
jgi:hypothetical protein